MRNPQLRTLACSLALAGLAASADAQGDFLFDIDMDATSFTWSGTTSLGPIVPDPPNFSLSGTTGLDLQSGGAPVGGGQYTGGGDALIVPNLHGEIPNPAPLLPPLAEIDVIDVHFVVHSDPFAVVAGSYTITGYAEVLSGTLVFDPLIGDTVTEDLAGLVTDSTTGTGVLVEVSGTLDLSLTLDLAFDFMDPGTGVSGSITLVGTMIADFACPAPAAYCQTSPNSVGPGAVITGTGSTSVEANAFTLHCDGLPAGQFGIFYYGPGQTDQPFGDGRRCVAGSVVRLAPINSGPGGSVSRLLDFPNLPPAGLLEAGDTRNFQFWYRDPMAMGAGFNLSGGLEVFFCP